MALIKQIKAQEKSKLTIAVSKKLNDDFNAELDKFNSKNTQNIALDFDGFAKKLITELKSINAKLDQVVS
jgi:hypothetical protein